MVKIKVDNETPHQKFRRLAEPRTQKVLDALRILGNCANPQIYSYNQEEVDKILKTVKLAFDEVKKKFELNFKKNENEKFQL